MIICDLCGQNVECLQKEIEGREYDICRACWNALAEKLKGKGRELKETVLLPRVVATEMESPLPPEPRMPPKIVGRYAQ